MNYFLPHSFIERSDLKPGMTVYAKRSIYETGEGLPPIVVCNLGGALVVKETVEGEFCAVVRHPDSEPAAGFYVKLDEISPYTIPPGYLKAMETTRGRFQMIPWGAAVYD